MATLAAGLDGLMIEFHPDPASALSDADQALTPQMFRHMMKQLRALAPSVGKTIS
jgi:3-deoxy-7-phosphoheptulonate synthase